MCNLSEGVERKGIEKGMKKALENLIHNTGWTIEKAMETLGIPSSERTSYEKLLNLRQ